MTARDGLRIVAGAILMAAIAWSILAAPGFLSDQASTVAVVVSSQGGAMNHVSLPETELMVIRASAAPVTTPASPSVTALMHEEIDHG